MIFIIDYICHLINESKMLIFVYNNDRIIYIYTTQTYYTIGKC